MPESRAILDRDELVVYLTHSQHRWEKHGDEDVLAIDIQCKLTNQEDWIPVLCDLTGWSPRQVEAYCELNVAAYGAKEFPWEGGFDRHQVRFLSVIGGDNRTEYAVIWEGKINKFKSVFKDAEMTFRIQGTIESEDVASEFISLERDLIALNISPLQMPRAEGKDPEPSPQQSMDMTETPEPEDPAPAEEGDPE